MVSPDSDQRFHPGPELLVPIEGNFAGKDVLSMSQFDRASLEILFDVSEQMERQLEANSVPKLLEGIQIGLIFAEASTRTSGSFGSVVLNLGGKFLRSDDFPRVENPKFVFKVIELKVLCQGGIIVMRHPQEGAVVKAAEVLRSTYPEIVVPIINAGDGIGEHPTQAMLDMYTIKRRLGRLHGLKGVIAGDPKNGRTSHSLVNGLSRFDGNTLYLLSPRELRLREKERSQFASLPINIIEIENPDEIPEDTDFWYWTRIQKERFEDPQEYEAVKDSMILTGDLLKRRGNPNMIIMHPGPVISEVERSEIEHDPRWIYWEQIGNGIPVRMALLGLVLDKVK